MKVLITGGAGYVGSACLRALLAAGHEAVAFDNLTEGHAEAVPGDRLVVGDLTDEAAVRDALAGADAVMHFAAKAYVGESVKAPEDYYRTNVAGSLNLLRAMRAVGVRRLLFSSTCALYGPDAPVPIPETASRSPDSPYARSKLAVEWMIEDFAAAYGLGFTLLRYFNAAGASPGGAHGEDHAPETHLIPLVLQVPLRQREKVYVFGDDYATPDGSCVRDYVHTEDLARAHLLAMEATGPATRAVYNVGTGRGHSVLDVIRTCEEVVGERIPYEVTGRRPGDAHTLVADASRLRTGLGWRPAYPTLRDIVASAWAWHRAHPFGYRTKQTEGVP